MKRKTTNHSKQQRERIVAALSKQPMTNLQLSETLHLDRATTLTHIKAMMSAKARKIYICGYEPRPTGGRRTPIYAPGNFPDAVFVGTRENTTRHLINKENEERIMALLEREAMTSRQIARHMGKSDSLVRRALRRLREEPQRVYVSGWAASRTSAAARYSLGNLPDAERTNTLLAKRIVRHAVRKTGWAAALGI